MKKIIMTAIVLMVAAMGYGQVVRGTIGQGVYTLADGTEIPMYGLDFNNDGNLEFVVSAYFDNETYQVYENAHLEYRLDVPNNVITNSQEDYMSIKLLTSGQTVGMTCSFLGEGEAVFSDFGAISDTASYAGFMVTYEQSVHYGYARFHISRDSVIWDAIYYNATAGQGITVGDRGADTGVEESSAGRFLAAAMEGGMINVMLEREGEVQVYDMSGRKVGESRGENVMIRVPGAGVYVVKSGGASAKIIVK